MPKPKPLQLVVNRHTFSDGARLIELGRPKGGEVARVLAMPDKTIQVSWASLGYIPLADAMKFIRMLHEAITEAKKGDPAPVKPSSPGKFGGAWEACLQRMGNPKPVALDGSFALGALFDQNKQERHQFVAADDYGLLVMGFMDTSTHTWYHIKRAFLPRFEGTCFAKMLRTAVGRIKLAVLLTKGERP